MQLSLSGINTLESDNYQCYISVILEQMLLFVPGSRDRGEGEWCVCVCVVCRYCFVFPQAMVSLMNGVDVVIGTPTSILKLLKKEALSLKHILKLVWILSDICNMLYHMS